MVSFPDNGCYSRDRIRNSPQNRVYYIMIWEGPEDSAEQNF